MKALLSLCLLATFGSAIAQVHPIAPKRGAYSVGFSADWFRNADGTTHSTFFATPAYFVTDQLELRLPLGFVSIVGPSETLYGIGARWHFGHGILDPFVGAVWEEARATRFRENLIAVQVGAHYFVANNVALTTLVTFGRDRTNGVTQDTTHLVSGFTIFFSDR